MTPFAGGRRPAQAPLRLAILVLAVVAATHSLAGAARAQTTPAGSQPIVGPLAQASPPGVAPSPDIELTATLHIDELRFDATGSMNVQVRAQPSGGTVLRWEHENLPEVPQPGVSYRNVTVRLTISSALGELERVGEGTSGAPTP
jgi:hypothetical protein